MKKPKSQIQVILLDLIRKNKGVTEEDYGWHAFRHYISKLREHLTIKFTEVSFISTFGKPRKYRRHWLTNSEKAKAVKLYNNYFK